MQKLSSIKYNFEVTEDETFVIARLWDDKGKQKVFKVSRGQTTVQALTNHMNTLTDTLCEQFLKNV